MKKIIKYSDLINENNTIDTILDKINKDGIDSLTNFEKDILSTASKKSNIQDDTEKWLDSKYLNLNLYDEKRKSFGKEKDYILFLDDNMDMIFDYDVERKTLYISYKDIRTNLGDHFNDLSLINWFRKNYQIDVRKISDYFENID